LPLNMGVLSIIERARRRQPHVLRTSSGDVDAVVSRNKEFVSNVRKAVEQAFVVRARQPPVSET